MVCTEVHFLLHFLVYVVREDKANVFFDSLSIGDLNELVSIIFLVFGAQVGLLVQCRTLDLVRVEVVLITLTHFWVLLDNEGLAIPSSQVHMIRDFL